MSKPKVLDTGRYAKCGEIKHRVEYRGGVPVFNMSMGYDKPIAVLPVPSYMMLVTCMRCGFEWVADSLDKREESGDE